MFSVSLCAILYLKNICQHLYWDVLYLKTKCSSSFNLPFAINKMNLISTLVLTIQTLHSSQIYYKRTIVNPILVKTYSRPYFSEFFDMVFLRHLIWPFIRNYSSIYDSYNCQKHRELGVGQPWPTRRNGSLYVGSGPTKGEVLKRLKRVMCPVACRPGNHRDWLYC